MTTHVSYEQARPLILDACRTFRRVGLADALENAQRTLVSMRKAHYDEPEPSHVDCGRCYGNGCSSCGGRGTVETSAGREAREEHEDGAYDRWRDDRMTEDR